VQRKFAIAGACIGILVGLLGVVGLIVIDLGLTGSRLTLQLFGAGVFLGAHGLALASLTGVSKGATMVKSAIVLNVIIVCLWLAGCWAAIQSKSPAGPKAAVAMFVVGVLPSVLNVVAVRNRKAPGTA
jgi:hypothetical protein